MRTSILAWRAWLYLLLAAGLGAGVSCTYSPDFDNGKLICGAKNACPKGYTCVAGHTCAKDGSTTSTGTGGASGSGGRSGSGGNGSGGSGPGGSGPLTRDDLVGTWSYVQGSILTISCSDGPPQSKDLQTETLAIAAGTAGAVNTFFYCPWILDVTVSPADVSGSIRPNQSCTSRGGCTDFTWMAQSFDFVTGDGATATLDATIPATFKDYTNPLKPMDTTACLPTTTVSPKTGTCTLTVTADLTKQ
ncbi:MAG: hypothetical protein QOI66_1036 [Myxococcales bacterium]|nr:hypothetical protein [Myxococcales bacterium]